MSFDNLIHNSYYLLLISWPQDLNHYSYYVLPAPILGATTLAATNQHQHECNYTGTNTGERATTLWRSQDLNPYSYYLLLVLTLLIITYYLPVALTILIASYTICSKTKKDKKKSSQLPVQTAWRKYPNGSAVSTKKRKKKNEENLVAAAGADGVEEVSKRLCYVGSERTRETGIEYLSREKEKEKEK